jgi:hypothetical protein
MVLSIREAPSTVGGMYTSGLVLVLFPPMHARLLPKMMVALAIRVLEEMADVGVVDVGVPRLGMTTMTMVLPPSIRLFRVLLSLKILRIWIRIDWRMTPLLFFSGMMNNYMKKILLMLKKPSND